MSKLTLHSNLNLACNSALVLLRNFKYKKELGPIGANYLTHRRVGLEGVDDIEDRNLNLTELQERIQMLQMSSE